MFIAQDVYHHLKNKRSGGKYEVALKMDMKKAYDRVEWDFLEALMKKLGFCEKWVARVMNCVSTVSYNLCLAGNSIASFKPSGGLRQGDPLSPYLFLLVSDVLSELVSHAVNLGRIKGLKLARKCPVISHCFFADDTLFFLIASEENCVAMKEVLDIYCFASGQEANLQKSGIFFSSNIIPNVKNMVCLKLGVDAVDPGLYLGILAVWERSKCDALSFVKDRVARRVNSWKRNFLSFGGK